MHSTQYTVLVHSIDAASIRRYTVVHIHTQLRVQLPECIPDSGMHLHCTRILILQYCTATCNLQLATNTRKQRQLNKSHHFNSIVYHHRSLSRSHSTRKPTLTSVRSLNRHDNPCPTSPSHDASGGSPFRKPKERVSALVWRCVFIKH
jgi:hypothetical protein